MQDFEEVVDRLRKILQGPLPGAIAHEPLRATSIGDLKPNFEHKMPPKPGSVLILLYPDNGHIKFPLTKRSAQQFLPLPPSLPGSLPVRCGFRGIPAAW